MAFQEKFSKDCSLNKRSVHHSMFTTLLLSASSTVPKYMQFTQCMVEGCYKTYICTGLGGVGGVPPCKRLMGMCRWMGLHFHNWIYYNGVAFLVELLEWGHTFSGFLG